MTPSEFAKQLCAAQAGDRIRYHVGNLARDRGDPSVDRVGDIAWKVGAPKGFEIGGRDDTLRCGGFGAGSLVQQNYKGLIYEYFIVMRRKLSPIEVAAVTKAARLPFGASLKDIAA